MLIKGAAHEAEIFVRFRIGPTNGHDSSLNLADIAASISVYLLARNDLGARAES